MPFDLNDWSLASTDDTTATKAQTAAGVAKSTADTAVTNAATAQSTANTAKKNAATAQSTADSAITDAFNAQSTADTAITNAATAQSTADTAITDAANAQSTADSAATAATNAAKTATNYLSYDSTNGLVVGNQTGSKLGGNVQITAEPAVNLRNGSDVLAKFTTNQLLLSGGEYNTTYASITAYDDGENSWGIFGGTPYSRHESSIGSSTAGLTAFVSQGSNDVNSYALLHTHTNTTNPFAAIELFNLPNDQGGYNQGLNVFCGDYHGKLAFFPSGAVYINTSSCKHTPQQAFQGSFTQITPTTTATVTTPLARVKKTITRNTGACTANYLQAYTMGGMCFVSGQVTPTSAGTDKMLLYISGVEPLAQTYFPLTAYGHGSSEGYVKKVNSGQSHVYFNIPETGDWKFNFAFATTTSTESQSVSVAIDNLRFWESNGWTDTNNPLETT